MYISTASPSSSARFLPSINAIVAFLVVIWTRIFQRILLSSVTPRYLTSVLWRFLQKIVIMYGIFLFGVQLSFLLMSNPTESHHCSVTIPTYILISYSMAENTYFPTIYCYFYHTSLSICMQQATSTSIARTWSAAIVFVAFFNRSLATSKCIFQ